MTQNNSSSRPLSPHLSIYKWQVTMTLSILHRATGVALAIGSVLLVGWIWSAAYDARCFDAIHGFFNSTLGKILLFGWTASFYLHFCNGIRHLFWDIGVGFEKHISMRTAWAVLIATVFFTLTTWSVILSQGAQ